MKSEKTEKWFLIVLIGACFILLPCIGHTAIPQKINYQGYLTNSAGVAVNGTLPIVFSIYDVSSGGSALWNETQNVSVTNGVYNVALGELTPIALTFDVPYYLGVKVGADPEMTPRQPLLTVGYAFRAKYADSGGAGLALPYAGSTSNPGGPSAYPIAFSVTHTAQGIADEALAKELLKGDGVK